MDLEDIVLSEVTQSQKNSHYMHSLIRAQKLRIPKIQFTNHMKLKKEHQSEDTSILLRMGNKIPMEGVTETKFGAAPEGRTIQRLPHMGIHCINNHQTQTLDRCQQEPTYRRLI